MKILALLAAALFCESTFAGARHFTYLYEAPTSAPGSFELENYATSRWLNGSFEPTDFRHEIEIGVTDRLQLGVYIANWEYSRRNHAAHYDSASIETIYNLTNPAADPIGISVYEEISWGRRVFESETKLILQKNFGPLILLYNFTVEGGWSGENLREHEAELQQSLGLSYELDPRLLVGVEMLSEILLHDWRSADSDQDFFIGPNISYRSNRWFIVLTGLRQLTSTEGEADYQVRLIFGIGFEANFLRHDASFLRLRDRYLHSAANLAGSDRKRAFGPCRRR